MVEGRHRGFWWRNLRERENLEDLAVNGKILKWMFQDVG